MMKGDIRTFLSQLKSGRGPHLVLLFGDDLQVDETCKAAVDLVEQVGGTVVGCAFLIELTFLEGRKALDGYDVQALIAY